MTSRTAAALLAAAALTCGLWLAIGTQATLPDLAPGEQGWSGDFRSFYLPNAEYLGARLSHGELPLWNPHQGLGAPFLATLQPGVLYPPNWLHALHGWLPVQTVFLWLAVLHLALAVFLTGGLAQALGAGALGGTLAGVSYASSLQVVGTIWSPPVLYSAAWAPGILWAVERCVARPSGRAAAALAAVLGVSLLTGWPYTVAIACLAAALYGGLLLPAAAWQRRRVPWGAAAALLFGVVAGLGLAAAQLLPSLELLERSCRALGTLVEGQALGGGVVRPYEPADFAARLLHRGFNDAIPGWLVLALTLPAVALPGPGRRRGAALLAVAALLLLASFPHHVPVYGWLRELPVFSDFRFPFRYRLVPTLALSVTAGVGFAHLARRIPGARVGLGLGVVLLAGVFASAALPTFRSVLPFARQWPAEPDLAAQVAARAGPGWRPAGGRIFWAERADKLRHPVEVDAVHDLEPLTLARTAELLTFFETGRATTLLSLPKAPPGRPPGDSLAPPFFGFVRLPNRPRRAPLLDLISVDTLVADAPPAWMFERYRAVNGEGDAARPGPVVFRNPHALPRAYRVTHALAEPPRAAAALGTLLAPRFEPHALVLLDAPPPALLLQPGRAAAPTRGDTAMIRRAPEHVRLRTRGPEPAVVVVTDAFFPGWEARVDGAPAKLLRANFALRGVAVPAGEHEVEMRYRPAPFRVGLALSGLALAACAIAVWPGRRAGRRPGGYA